MVISLNYGAAFVSQEIEAIEDKDDLDHQIEVGVCYSIRESKASENRAVVIRIVDMDVAARLGCQWSQAPRTRGPSHRSNLR